MVRDANGSARSSAEILAIANSKVKPRIPLPKVVKAWTYARERDKRVEEPKQEIKEATEPLQEIDAEVNQLTMGTISDPFLPVTDYYNRRGWSYRKGTAIKTAAIGLKLLVQHEYHDGSRGGKKVYLAPTEKACEMFGVPYPYHNPGFLHKCITHLAGKAKAEQGYKIFYEENINGKRIDLVLQLEGKQTAVETAVTDKHEIVNLRKDVFQAGFQRVVIIGKDRKVVAAVEKKLKAAFDIDVLSKVKVCVLAEFIKERQ